MGGGAIGRPFLHAATLFLLHSAAFFLALPESANAQIWVTSGFLVTPATPVSLSGITFTPGNQTETAYCSTSVVDPATGQNSPAAADYSKFIAYCTLTPSDGTTIVSTSCPSGSGYQSGNPSILCTTEFVPQPNVIYTINSWHALLFNRDPSGTVCGQPNYNWLGLQFCWSDPLGYYSINPGASNPWPPIPNYPGVSSNVSPLAINTVDVTCGAIGTCAPQTIPYEYCLSGSAPFCSDALVTPSRWWVAQTSEPWQVKCSDVVQGSVTPYLVSPTEINATFTPNYGFTLAQAAKVCGFIEFDWQQTITSWPLPSPLREAGSNVPLHAPPSFNDPPPNGYDYDNPHSPDPLKLYYNPFSGPSDNYALSSYTSTDTNTLYFDDAPANNCMPGGTGADCNGQTAPPGSMMAFTTHLVGLQGDLPGAAVIDTGIGFSWTSTYNGTHGGISMSRSKGPVDMGSGTGGITITAVSETSYNQSGASSLPTLLAVSQVSTTGSGLAYSRVSKLFIGTLTITNDSSETITGPFQIVLDSLQSNVTLANATGIFGGWPYITVPNVTSLEPGQSATAAVRFSNPSDEILNYYPAVYSGSFE